MDGAEHRASEKRNPAGHPWEQRGQHNVYAQSHSRTGDGAASGAAQLVDDGGRRAGLERPPHRQPLGGQARRFSNRGDVLQTDEDRAGSR